MEGASVVGPLLQISSSDCCMVWFLKQKTKRLLLEFAHKSATGI